MESAIARFQRIGSARWWDGSFFTTWSTPLIGTLAKVDRKKAEQINQELQKKLCQTFQTEAAIDLACDQDRVLREHFPQTARSHEKRYFFLIWKKFTSRDIWFKRKTRTTKPRQHDLCQSGKSGSSSDNIVTWDIRSQRSWLVRYDMQEQGEKLCVFLGHGAPNCSALVDRLHREDRDERVHNCLGETLWMAGVQNSWEMSSRTRQELQAS